jgi:hypothetical protein
VKIFDNPVPILLNAANPALESPHVTVGALTSKVAIRIQRPTTAVPVNWDSTGTVRVIVVMEVDGVQHFARGQATGGIRLDINGNEMPYYELRFSPPVVNDNGTLKRIGQKGTVLRGWVRLERMTGTIQTNVLLAETEEAPV